jgi:light-regulated signal transduction histidine kinase (bacteriophytochrome)
MCPKLNGGAMSSPVSELVRSNAIRRRVLPVDDSFVRLGFDSLHDLTSPINQMCTVADLIVHKCKGSLDEDSQTLFGLLRGAAERAQNLLSGLRAYAQLMATPDACSRCEGETLLAGSLAMVEHTISRHNGVITHDPLPVLWCDPAKITYVLASLVENSLRFSRGRPEIHVGSYGEKNTTVITVRDNGIGIDPRYTDRIFQTFKRINNDEYPGAGVGLAIARHVVERHGGRIWAESEPEHGSTFFLALPKLRERGNKPSSRKYFNSSRAVA